LFNINGVEYNFDPTLATFQHDDGKLQIHIHQKAIEAIGHTAAFDLMDYFK
jgi:hypothetical protein